MLKLSTIDLQKIEEYYDTAYKAIGYLGISDFALQKWERPRDAWAISYNRIRKNGKLDPHRLICSEKEIKDFLCSNSAS